MPRIEAKPNKASFETHQNFLIDRFQDGVPISSRLTYVDPLTFKNEELNARAWDLLGRYFGTDATLEQAGEQHGLTRERVRQINKRSTKKLLKTAPSDIQEKYPLETLGFAKPQTFETSNKKSISRGGKSVHVLNLVHEGSTTASEIQRKTNVTTVELSRARVRLRRWGVKVPFISERNSPEYQQRLRRLADPDISDEEARTILDSISIGTYQTHSQGEYPLLIALSNIAKDVGLHMNYAKTSLLAQVLQEANIPVGIVPHTVKKTGKTFRCYFIASSYRERVQEAFLKHPALEKYKKQDE